MNDLFQRHRYSLEFKKRVNRRLMIMVRMYVDFCQEINQRTDKRCQVKEFDCAYLKCQLYFNSVPRNLAVKKIAEKVLYGRPLLLAILPKEHNVHYNSALKEYNAIVQYCMDERRSRHEISIFNAKELQKN